MAENARNMAVMAREQGRVLASLPSAARKAILNRVADGLLANVDAIITENKKDIAEAQGKISPALLQVRGINVTDMCFFRRWG